MGTRFGIWLCPVLFFQVCYGLSLDESLRPAEPYVVFNRDDLGGFEAEQPVHHLHKRDVITNKDNIIAKVERLNDSHQQLLVHWTGMQGNVFICLARSNWETPHSTRPPVPSTVYISYDSQATYVNKTESFALEKPGTYASVDKFYNHPRNQAYMVFIDKYNSMIFTSRNFGGEIKRVSPPPPFQPVDVSFYPEDPNIFLVHDKNKTLWITRDFGGSFSIAEEYVKAFNWVDRWPGTWTDNPTRSLLVQRIEPSPYSTLIALQNIAVSRDPNVTVLMKETSEFIKSGDFIFVTRKNISGDNHELFISYRGGTFYRGIFGDKYQNTNFHIVDVSEVRLMVASAHNETLCNLYVSEVSSDSHYMFRLSLERLFCYFHDKMWKSSWLSDVTEDTFADLHKVKGMRGIYLASQVNRSASSDHLNPEHLRTLITFDWGGEWKYIAPPFLDEDGQRSSCNPINCTLHLTQKFMNLYPFAKTVPILSSASAPGLIVATGVLGSSLKGPTGVFVSRDAGLTWKKVLRDDYMYNFGDHGGIMTAVKYFKSTETQNLFYSTDQGESWKTFKFVDTNIRVYNLMTEPGENTTVFTLFGSELKKHGWMIISVDLRNAFKYNCTEEDYRPWTPSGGLREMRKKSICVMGEEVVFERRVQHADCYNGRNYDRPITKQSCPCDIEDFECDFGFTRHVASSGCIRIKSITPDPYAIPSSCKPGSFYNRTKGYKKIAGDSCEGGFDWQYLPDVIPCPFKESNHFLLVAVKNKIMRYDLAEPNPKPQTLPIKGISNVIAIDFDMQNNCLFYADIEKDFIARQCLSGNRTTEILVESGLKSVEGIAYDWISKMLYFVDGNAIKIEAIRTDISHSNRMRKLIIDNNKIEKPRGIALHPAAGYLYWTDWSLVNPHVGRSNLDGSDVRYLFKKPAVHWPNGITVDHIAEQIYFVDAKLDYIAAADLQGHNIRKIIQSSSTTHRLAHPFSIAVFKDLVYWDDWERRQIFIADKDQGVGARNLTDVIDGLMDIKVFAHSLQEGKNGCSNKSEVCSHLCFAQPDGHPPVCECPDDMIMKQAECRCPDGSLPSRNHTCPKKGQCRANEFACPNDRGCIPISWKCNGYNDCGDMSDEVGCAFQTCDLNSFRCGSGTCIPKYWACDGEKDCLDGDDEAHCAERKCKPSEFQCNNSVCIPNKWRCDGESDCIDRSDEENCPTPPPLKNCTEAQFQCNSTKTCISLTWVCDKERDCPDGSDESNCPTTDCDPASQFTCTKSKKCIYQSWVCDGDNDCGPDDNSDESNCTITTPPPSTPDSKQPTFPCREFMWKCADNTCIPEWWKCDNVTDCPDGSDEEGCNNTGSHPTPLPYPTVPPQSKCPKNSFRCETGDCIPTSWTCDGKYDCKDGSDELQCRVPTECPPGFLKCHFSNSCYHSRQACDGHFDCPDHSDEKDCANKASDNTPSKFTCRSGHFKCPEGTCVKMSRQCDGKKDCLDGSDEDKSFCEKFERVYQVDNIVMDRRRSNGTFMAVSWSVDRNPPVKLEYLPSICQLKTTGPQYWNNHTAWLKTPSYIFDELIPFTKYNVTVYVRVAGKPRVFPPALYLVLVTPEDLPMPPWNVTVVQKSDDIAEVSWLRPTLPNGIITEYWVFSTPPLPPMKTLVIPQNGPSALNTASISTQFEPNARYTFWVVAVNSAGASNDSALAVLKGERALIGNIGEPKVHCLKRDCTISWKAAEGASGYRIVVSTNPPYPAIPIVYLYNTTTYKFKEFAPGVSYTVSINAFHKTFNGQMSIVSILTEGPELPVIRSITGELQNKSSGISVSLKWEPPKSDFYKINSWTYGVYYGTNEKQLLAGPKNLTKDTHITLEKMEACITYLIDIGVTEPLGYGPLSANPFRITTPYHPLAPPRNLTIVTSTSNETMIYISWEASCFQMDHAIGYIVMLEEQSTKQLSILTLLPTNATKIQHRIYVDYGARYKMTVRTTARGSLKSEPVIYWAPALPAPHQVRVERYKNNSAYEISWDLHVTTQIVPDHMFEVLVSEGEELNESSATIYRTAKSPYIIPNIKLGTPYSVAVRLTSYAGYKSSLSEINNIRLLPESEEQAQDEESGGVSAGWVFLLVFGIVFILFLAGVLGVYTLKQHRLRNSFANFANSHYSTSSGAAIFTDRLDDEDSPVIQGFSDDEPLVVA